MRSVRGKVIILVALGLLWAVLFVTYRPGQPLARPTAQAGSQSARTPTGRSGGFPRLKLEMLTLPRTPYPADEQNIFGTPPPPPAPPRPVEAARPAPPPAPPPPDPFQELVKQFRYVGFLRDGNAATAFIVQGQQVLTVTVGEVVADRFQVMEVGEDFVILASPAGDKQARLPLAGEAGAPLRPQIPATGMRPPAQSAGDRRSSDN
ncbi:MAG: hypothetical protein WCI75_04655 [candidate division NC10 bacterium]